MPKLMYATERAGWASSQARQPYGSPWEGEIGEGERRGGEEQMEKYKTKQGDFCKCLPLWRHVA